METAAPRREQDDRSHRRPMPHTRRRMNVPDRDLQLAKLGDSWANSVVLDDECDDRVVVALDD